MGIAGVLVLQGRWLACDAAALRPQTLCFCRLPFGRAAVRMWCCCPGAYGTPHPRGVLPRKGYVAGIRIIKSSNQKRHPYQQVGGRHAYGALPQPALLQLCGRAGGAAHVGRLRRRAGQRMQVCAGIGTRARVRSNGPKASMRTSASMCRHSAIAAPRTIHCPHSRRISTTAAESPFPSPRTRLVVQQRRCAAEQPCRSRPHLTRRPWWRRWQRLRFNEHGCHAVVPPPHCFVERVPARLGVRLSRTC